jgi:hypothetical protein
MISTSAADSRNASSSACIEAGIAIVVGIDHRKLRI